MNTELLDRLLRSVAEGRIPVDSALAQLRHMTLEDIDFAHIDHQRSMRKGFPEVLFGQGKTPEQIIAIMERMLLQEKIILVTRVDPDKADTITRRFQDAVYHPDARMIVWSKGKVTENGVVTRVVTVIRRSVLEISADTRHPQVDSQAKLPVRRTVGGIACGIRGGTHQQRHRCDGRISVTT